MGIYSINSINEASASSYLDDIQLEEVFEENYMEAALRHTYEIQENMNNVMKAIGIAELAEYEQTGREIDYVNESVSSVFNKIKEMLKKVWQKITSLFTKFMAKMQSFGKDDAAFVKKYRKDIITGSIDGLKVKGYKFTISGVLKANEMTDKLNADAIASIVVKLGDNIDISKLNFNNGLPTESDVEIMKELNKSVSAVDNNDIMDNIRGSLFKGESTLDQKEFNKKLFEVFRNNESSKIDIEDSDIDPTAMCNFLSGTRKSEKDIKDDYNVLNKAIKDDIKIIDKIISQGSKYNKTEDDATTQVKAAGVSMYSKLGNLLVQCKTVAEQVEAAKMNAFNECRRQYKAICVKLIGRKSKNESVDYSSNDTGSFNSFLDNVKLI